MVVVEETRVKVYSTSECDRVCGFVDRQSANHALNSFTHLPQINVDAQSINENVVRERGVISHREYINFQRGKQKYLKERTIIETMKATMANRKIHIEWIISRTTERELVS